LKQIAKEAEVDAVALIKLQIVTIQKKNKKGLTKDHLGLKAQISLIHKDGSTIIKPSQVFMAASKRSINFKKSILKSSQKGTIKINEKNRRAFFTVRKKLLNHIKKMLSDSKK